MYEKKCDCGEKNGGEMVIKKWNEIWNLHEPIFCKDNTEYSHMILRFETIFLSYTTQFKILQQQFNFNNVEIKFERKQKWWKNVTKIDMRLAWSKIENFKTKSSKQ